MGEDRQGPRVARRGWVTDARVARVVPDLASFSVDAGFEYLVADHDVRIGSLVRVPLSGRPRRGYVVGLRTGEGGRLKKIRSVSGDHPVFDERLLAAVDELVAHYVAPRSVLLAKTAPPNLPRNIAELVLPSVPSATSPVPDVSRGAARGEPGGHVQLLTGAGWAETIRASITSVVAAGRSAAVVVATASEAARLAALLRRDLGARVVEHGGDDAAVTRAWVHAATMAGVVVVGTPKILWWPIYRLSAIVLVDEGRRGMKERQTPTVAASRVAATRARHQDLAVVHIGRVPTSETFSLEPKVVRLGGRLWPPVEIVDRYREPPGSGLFTSRVRDAVRQVLRDGGQVLLFTHRHGYAPAARCGTCRELRLCGQCGARPDPGEQCRRCGADLGPCTHCGAVRFEPLGAGVERVIEEARRVFPDGGPVRVGSAGGQIHVGTERDLVVVEPVDVAAIVDADGLIRGTNYRAGEDALALFARVAARVRSGRTNRLLVQTAAPQHPVLEALRTADPVPFLERDLVDRRTMGMPPCADLIVVEVSGLEDADHEIREVASQATVFGPASHDGTDRWLVQGADLSELKAALRPVVGRFRERGGKVRVDVDARDL